MQRPVWEMDGRRQGSSTAPAENLGSSRLATKRVRKNARATDTAENRDGAAVVTAEKSVPDAKKDSPV
jgi:hypothetical protein